VTRRPCYIHGGPHKTGTKSIQWFLKENRAELLRRGYFVPESGNIHGGHHAIVKKLCGQVVPDRQESAVTEFAHGLAQTQCEAVIISSETLHGLLAHQPYAKQFFGRVAELDLVPRLIFFPRNQPQAINSRYAEVIKSFQSCERFERFVEGTTGDPALRYSLLLELADAFQVGMVACPFAGETISRGVVSKFLEVIGLDPSQFSHANARRNQVAGPFTVSVARRLFRLIRSSGKQLKWLQAERCKRLLAAYLAKNGWTDTGYCGLTTTMARRIEKEWLPDNDAFAKRVWGRSWNEVFSSDICREFTPNDLEILGPVESIEQQLCQAVHEMTPPVQDVMLDPALAVEATWNELPQPATALENKCLTPV
jgi:hypothetical protein